MKNSKKIVLLLVLSLLISLFSTVIYADSDSYITVEYDKTEAKVGEVIKASVVINNLDKFGGFQVCLRYNPEVFDIIDPESGTPFSKTTIPSGGTIMVNSEYSPIPMATNDTSNGLINFGRAYMNLIGYRNKGKAESTGVLGVIGLKVKKEASSELLFDDLGTLPGSTKGTMIFDWDGNIVKNYDIKTPTKINPSSSPIPLPSYKPSTNNNSVSSPADAKSSDAAKSSDENTSISSPEASKSISADSSKSENTDTTKKSVSTSKNKLFLAIIALAVVVILIPVLFIIYLKRKK